LAAQANDRVSDDSIAVAKAAIAHAEQAGGPESAPVEMAAARDKLALAEKANDKHDYKPAADWAAQANIDAQVAEATATQVRSRKAAAEFDASMQTLRQEANRAAQPAQ
jgi:cytochrome c peroxidase